MPVYNEEACIAEVVDTWYKTLSKLQMSFKIFVYNDGSTDGTANALAVFSGNDQVEIVNKENSGHGPTILAGYQRAVSEADWVFQCDSDDEMKADYFPVLWEKRTCYDALFGVRVKRKQSRGRKLISWCSRMTVRLLFKQGVTDVNTPYRLMRANVLKQIIAQIPGDTFAPNVIISGALARGDARIFESAVQHDNRRTGSASLVKWQLWKSVIKSFWQTLHCHPKINLGPSK